MKNIVVFTGAGISQESGIQTFRDATDGLYADHELEKVVTVEGFKDSPKLVMDFHNVLRNKIKDKKPNIAHRLLAELENDFNVTIITQNVDNLHELAGSTNVLHLHGELNKAREIGDNDKIYDCGNDLNYGDVGPNGMFLRPHTVLFGEMPFNVDESYEALDNADYLIVIGTSLNIGYTVPMLGGAKEDVKVFYIDPKPSKDLEYYFYKIEYIKSKASIGVKKLYNILKKDE